MKFVIEYEAREVLEIIEKEPDAKFFSHAEGLRMMIKVNSSSYDVCSDFGDPVSTYPLSDLLNLTHRRFIRENDPNVLKLDV